MNKINRIAHAGDTHFFISKKFEEHQYVCNKFYEELEKDKYDLCVLTGDLIDSKLRLGPEQINLCRNFLQNITNYCPLIIILGNHDLNLANADRLDSISPILYSLYNQTNHPIHFLKHSGIYNLYNIDWAVWSCLDNQKSPFDSNFKKENYTIGLYHGPVKGCISENGFILNDGIDLKEFDGCDTVMLGDVHQTQSFRNTEIVYSGNFLQTKITEEPFGSFIKWDWDGKTFIPTVKRLENIYSTITQYIPDDFSLMANIPVLSPNQTILLRYETDLISKIQATEYKKQLQSTYKNNIELKPIVRKKIKLKDELESGRDTHIDLKGFLVEYVRRNKDNLDIKVFEEDIIKVLELDDLYSSNLDISKDFELGDFSIQKIIINNLFSFPPGITEISFDLEGVIGINAPNTSGKSNVLKTLQFVLYNSSPNNTPSLKKIINKYNRNKEASGELYLSKNGNFYHIKRTIIPKKKDGITISLEFRQVDIDGNEVVNLTGEKRQDTEKEIQKLFGIESMFEILSVFSAQKKQIEFIDCRNSERLTLVNRFLGLQSFEQKEKEVADELRKDRAVFDALLKEFTNVSISELENNYREVKEKFEAKSPLVDSYKSELDKLVTLNKSLLDLYEETTINANRKVNSLEEIRSKLSATINKILLTEAEILTLEESLSENTKLLDELKLSFKDKTQEDIKSYRPNYKICKSEEDKKAIINSELNKYDRQLKIEFCTNCGKDFSEEDKKKVQEKIDELLIEQKVLEDFIIKTNDEIEALVSEQLNYNEIGRKMFNLQNSILEKKNFLQKQQNEKNSLSIENDEYEIVQKAKKILLTLKPKIEEYNQKKLKYEEDISNLKYELKYLKKEIEQKEKEISDYKQKMEQLELLQEQMRLLKLYKDIIHKDSLPLYILKTKIKSVNEQINLIVNQVFDFEIEFIIDEDAGELSVNFIYEGDTENNDVSLASGAETFIINLCIKVGLSQVSELPKINSLIIDEGYGTLDKETIDKIPGLFNVLNEYYKNIITISHLDDIKDMCQYQIKLEKKDKYTTVLV